jgi:trans-2,3-dihydro-3-hydroxyanthranilate isomerase
MPRKFHTLDVFTTRRFEGNPLAVVVDGEALSDAEMLTIAREFNLSETVFVQAPDDPINSAKIRIFTPGGELPFAGHPTIGTAILLAELRAGSQLGEGVVVALEEKIGLVKVEVRRIQGGVLRAVFDLPRLSENLGIELDVELAAKALGIDPLEMGFGTHTLSVWSAGVPYSMVPVRGLEVIRRVHVADRQAWNAAFAKAGREGAFIYTKETESPDHHVHARMFWPSAGIAEDPATGSAVAAFSGVAAAAERPDDGVHQLVIEQGFEMGRPSLIALDLDIRKGLVARASIGGSAVRVSEGVLYG